jgi:hypothetical protein
MKALLRTIVAVCIAVIVPPVTQASDEEAVIEYQCRVLTAVKSKTADEDTLVFKVLTLGASEQLRFPGGADPKTNSILCIRSLLVPSLNDAKVLQAGYTLFIGAPGAGSDDARMATFAGSKPNVVFLVVEGTATRSEARITERVLKAINRS